jgi:hypothetical protein
VAGYTTGSAAGKDFIVIKLAPSLVPTAEEQELHYDYSTRISIHPNPFRDNVSITLSAESKGTRPPGAMSSAPCIKIYDATGRLIQSFTQLPITQLLNYHITWHGQDDHDRAVPAGVYFVRLEAGDYEQTEKVVLLR